MLEDACHSNSGTAWWHDSQHECAIAVERRSTQPDPTKCSFFAPDFALAESDPWLVGERRSLSFVAQPQSRLTHRAEPSSAHFAQMHEEILARIRAGEFQKVVPIVCEQLEFAEPLRAAMFATTIRSPHPQQIAYGFEFEEEGMCGVTPELLFQVKGGRLTTMALAGTGRVDGPSLLEDKKERLEHQLVIEHIFGELRRWGEPEVGVTQERAYGSLKHLYTPLEMRLRKQPTFLELVVHLHPTAALGGWPRQPAIEWLQAQAFHSERKRFGAPFGYIEGDTMLCAVAIRGLQWKDNCALLSAGCGVVAGSEALKEWRELQLKRNATCRLLGLEL